MCQSEVAKSFSKQNLHHDDEGYVGAMNKLIFNALLYFPDGMQCNVVT